ncbi:DUF1015 domain-containing protein [Chloroflexota bacterium]
MAEIFPFSAVHYSQARFDDLSSLICPPYDIISLQQQQVLYAASEYNFVRLEFTSSAPDDTGADSRYSRARNTLDQWLAGGVLTQDDTPAVYLSEQVFTSIGKTYRRLGLTATVKLEEWAKMVVRPHEGTLGRPKADRLKLLNTLKANTSPIFSFYEDPGQEMAIFLIEQMQQAPMLAAPSAAGEAHCVWAITDAVALASIGKYFQDKPLYIADGHHRYESALAYRDQCRAADGEHVKGTPSEQVMMTLVAMDDPGLVILPTHRLVRGFDTSRLESLAEKSGAIFRVSRVPLAGTDRREQVAELLGGADAPMRLAVFGADSPDLLLLEMINPAAAVALMPEGRAAAYHRLDVSVVDHVVLAGLLGIDAEAENATIAYTSDAAEAIRLVAGGEYQLAVMLRSTGAATIKEIADAGEKMPRKSTYFYPKLPAGLLVNQLG